MKRFLLSIFCIISLLTQVSNIVAQTNVIDEVIWVVGDDPILRSDVENWILSMKLDNQVIEGDPYCIVPEQMAIQKLYLHQARLDSIDVADSRVLQDVDKYLNFATNQLGSIEKVEEYFGMTISAIREQRKVTVKEQYQVMTMQQNLVSNVKVTPAEVRNFYNRIPADSLPYIPTSVEVEIITKEPVPSLAEVDAIKARLREFTDMVNSGEREFASLARMYSEDTESAKVGGELGFQGKAVLVPEFAAIAFELNDPKKVSRIVESEYGYHIIQLIEKRGDRINVRHILLKPEISTEELSDAVSKLDSVKMHIEEGKYTFEEAATYISDDKDTRMNKGLMVNQGREVYSSRIGTSRFEMDELPAEIAKAISTMKIGDVSEPFIMINSKQKKVAAMVRLRSRTEGHKASISEDFQTLRTLVEEEKKDELLNKWVEKKIKDTYIRVGENWRNCEFQFEGWVE